MSIVVNQKRPHKNLALSNAGVQKSVTKQNRNNSPHLPDSRQTLQTSCGPRWPPHQELWFGDFHSTCADKVAPPHPRSTGTVGQTYPTGLLCSDLGGLSCPVPSSGTAAAQTVHTAPLPGPRASPFTPRMCSPCGGRGGTCSHPCSLSGNTHLPFPLPCIPPHPAVTRQAALCPH